jgi:hypothetical protein
LLATGVAALVVMVAAMALAGTVLAGFALSSDSRRWRRTAIEASQAASARSVRRW